MKGSPNYWDSALAVIGPRSVDNCQDLGVNIASSRKGIACDPDLLQFADHDGFYEPRIRRIAHRAFPLHSLGITSPINQSHPSLTPIESLIDDIINAVNTIIYRAIEAVETGLLNLPPQQLGFPKSTNLTKAQVAQNQSLQQDEIENGCHQLETLLVDSADKTFDKFEIYTLRNILTVEEGLAPWMRLSHYEVRTIYTIAFSGRRSHGFKNAEILLRMEIGLITMTDRTALNPGSPPPPPRHSPNPRIDPPP